MQVLLSKWSQPWCNAGSFSFPIKHKTEFVCSLLRSLLQQLPLAVHVQLNWAGWDHFSWAKGEQHPGDGSTGKKVPLSPAFHAVVPDPHTLAWGGATSTGRCSVPPLHPQPCMRGTHGSLFSVAPKLKSLCQAAVLKKIQLIF